MTTRSEAKAHTYERVIQAAEKLYFTHGYRRTTIRDIAAEAGVSPGSVMTVGDKQTLLVTVFDRAVLKIHQGRTTEVASDTGDSLSTRTLALVAPFMDLFADRIDLAREYGAVLMGGGHRSVLFSELGDTLLSEIAVEARREGFDESSSEAAAKTAYLAYLGSLFYWAASGMTNKDEPQQDFISALEYIFNRESKK